jgi:nitrite reductase/ring-hydroxylating ferredoxin subunit
VGGETASEADRAGGQETLEADAAWSRLADLIEALETEPDATIRKQAEELLQAVDGVHRAALLRLTGLLTHHDLLDHAIADPVIGMLFELYDLAPADATAEPPARPETLGPPVTSGLIRLGDIRRFPATAPLPQSTTGAEGPAAVLSPARATASVPTPPSDDPVWTQVFSADQIARGTMAASADMEVLICNIGGAYHALRDRCGSSPLPLHFGELSGSRVLCPWHRDCAYDPATGESTSGRRTLVYPVNADSGVILVALNLGTSMGPLQPNQGAAPL